MDMFQAGIPHFTLNGKEHVQTVVGGVFSFSVLYITFLFAVMKLQHMIIKKNPTINFSVDEEDYSRGHCAIC